MRGVDLSKKLLLHAVMRDDNAANNGEVFLVTNPLIAIIVEVLRLWYNYLRTVN